MWALPIACAPGTAGAVAATLRAAETEGWDPGMRYPIARPTARKREAIAQTCLAGRVGCTAGSVPDSLVMVCPSRTSGSLPGHFAHECWRRNDEPDQSGPNRRRFPLFGSITVAKWGLTQER